MRRCWEPIRQGEGVSRASSQAAYPSFPPKGEKLAHSAAPPFPTEPATLGFGGDPVREVASARTAEGLMQRSRLSCAKSDCSLSKNRTAHSRQPLMQSNRWGTIPQTLRTQGQPPLHKGAIGAVGLHKCGGILILLCSGETDCHASDVGHWLAMTRWNLASATRGRWIIAPTGTPLGYRPSPASSQSP